METATPTATATTTEAPVVETAAAPAAEPTSLIAEATAPGAADPTAPAGATPEAEKQLEFSFKPEDLKIPEGFQVDEAARDDFVKIANEFKITPQAAEALVGLQAKLVQQSADSSEKAWTDMQTTWRNEVQTHPEIGGEKLEGVLGGIGKLVDQYGSKELREVMTLTGAGNNVHVVAFLNKIANQLNEPAPVSGAPVSSKSSLADALFTTMQKKV